MNCGVPVGGSEEGSSTGLPAVRDPGLRSVHTPHRPLTVGTNFNLCLVNPTVFIVKLTWHVPHLFDL